jgi:hypothetical protein
MADMTDSEIQRALAGEDSYELCRALIQIGKRHLLEFRSDVDRHLESSDPEVRGAAIQAAAFHWRLPEYRPIAQRMADSEDDPLTRSYALTAWSSYYASSKDKDVMGRLRDLLYDRLLPWEVRDSAYRGLMVVAGVDRRRFPVKRPFPDFDRKVDWSLIEELLATAGVRTDSSGA